MALQVKQDLNPRSAGSPVTRVHRVQQSQQRGPDPDGGTVHQPHQRLGKLYEGVHEGDQAGSLEKFLYFTVLVRNDPWLTLFDPPLP